MDRGEAVRLLLVEHGTGEDDGGLRAALGEAAGFRVETAAGAPAGCAYDAAVVACADGRAAEALETARRLAARCSAPILLVCPSSEVPPGAEADAAGVADVLAREDASPALLRHAVRAAVRRGRAERELAESRRRLETLLGSLPGMAYRCLNDPQWTLEFVSGGALGLTGYTADRLLGEVRRFVELIDPEDRDPVWRAVQEAVEAGRAFEVEYRIREAGGGTRWVCEHGRGVPAPDGSTVLEGIITDVTERKRVEAALRQSSDYFQALIESSAEAVAVGNADGTLRYSTATITRLLGYTPEERIGRSVFENIHPDDVAEARETLGRALREPGVTFTREVRVRHRDGSWRTLEVTLRNLLDDPAVAGIVYNSHDVTERRKAEEAALRSERQFRSLIQYGQDMIAVLEGDGDVRFTSPSVERVLGYEPAELEGAYFFERVHPDDVPAALEVVDRAIRAPGDPQRGEWRAQVRGGEWRTLEAIVTSLLHDPVVGGIVVNARDVTERKAAEEALGLSQQQLLQAQKMDAIGRLAGGVAHDFNNLLTAVRGNAELLLMDLPPDHASRPDVEEIRRAADRAAALTRQLLAFSRRQVLLPRVLDLNSVVQDLEKMLRRLIGEDVRLETRLDPGLERVRADPGQLEQVVLNLSINARDAMPEGGRLTVETRSAALDEQTARRYPYVVPGPYVMLAVHDTGHGMDPETAERAFEPFFTTKPPGRGTGLGLSTVYGIVKQSGGYIWIDSTLGAGTSVRIYLPPAAEDGEAAASSLAAPALARGAETILLAEDEDTVRSLARRVLERSGYTVLEASDGEEALAVATLHGGPVHLLITDVVMPHLGGRELARRIRASRPDARVLFISGYAEEAIAGHGVLEPGTAFIEKPFTADALAAKVRQVLDAPQV